MRKFLSLSLLAMGALLMPVAGSCQAAATPAKGQTAASEPTIAVEDQATVEQVERLFKVMRIREQMDLMMQQMSTMMQQQVSQGIKTEEASQADGKKLTPEHETARQQFVTKLMDRATHMYTVDELLADMTPIYQRHISKSDIEAFIAFFGSSSGQHFLNQQPLIVKEYMPVVMSRVQEKSKALTEEMKKDMEEFEAKERAAGNESGPKQ